MTTSRFQHLNNNVFRAISEVTGSNRYKESASMFNAVIETKLKGAYFIESSQFVCSDGSSMPREYTLKCINDTTVVPVIEFYSKQAAFKFFDNIKFTRDGGLILERSLINRAIFRLQLNTTARAEQMYYSDYTEAYSVGYKSEIHTYTEGDYIHTVYDTDKLYENAVKSYTKFNVDNN